jgi:hypothetical protein
MKARKVSINQESLVGGPKQIKQIELSTMEKYNVTCFHVDILPDHKKYSLHKIWLTS